MTRVKVKLLNKFLHEFLVPTPDMIHKRQTTVAASERHQTHALGRVATGICSNPLYW